MPLKVAFEGIDRYFKRYYAKGPRRRPVKIDFCEADVLDVFDEWCRAIGVVAIPNSESRRPSLPAHLERVVTRLTAARVNGSVGDEFDALVDLVAGELDAVRAGARGLRGEARQALIDRLASLDGTLLQLARGALDEAGRAALSREADAELAPFRGGMSADAFARAREGAIDRLVRERFGLPTIAFT